MSNNDWTNKLRDQLADYQEPVSRDLWAGIEQSLAQKTGHQEVSKPGKIIHINTWKRWSAAAAAVAVRKFRLTVRPTIAPITVTVNVQPLLFR